MILVFILNFIKNKHKKYNNVYLFWHIVDADREELASSKGKFAQYLSKILEVYFSYHHDAYSTRGLFTEMGPWKFGELDEP